MEMDGRGPHHPHHPHHPKPSPYVTREEFDMYDTIKTLSALSFCFFCKMIALGKCGKKAAWGNKSNVTKWVAKKSVFLVMILVVMSMFCGMQGHHIQKIMEKVHPSKPHHKEME
jgi:ABC-type microcin C transport system permease subunit YejE